MRCIAFEAHLRSKAPQCELCLIRLDSTEPSPCAVKNVVDGFGPLGHPPEVIWIAMSFDSAKALECLLQPYEHVGRRADLTMLRRRDADPAPVRTAFSRSRMVCAETSFRIKKAGCPSSFDNLYVWLRRHQSHVVHVVVFGTSAPSRSQLSRPISIQDLPDRCGRLRSLHVTQKSPEKRDRRLRLLEALCFPEIDPVFIRTGDRPHPERRSPKALEDLGDIPAVSALRHGRLKSLISTLLVRKIRDRGTFAVEESGGPCDLQRIERT